MLRGILRNKKLKTSQFLRPSEPYNMKIHIRYVLKFVHVTYPVAAATSLH
jgi:hypothetical protein